MPNEKKVLVALSGGVDSAVCVKLLQMAGYAVFGLFIRFSSAHLSAEELAKNAAKELGIPLFIADCKQQFEEKVIEPFCQQYAIGQTPNPCIMCNPQVKFSTLKFEAQKHNIPFYATGHYAKIVVKNGIYYVARPKSEQRDQSYMLYRLTQDILKNLLLPLGEKEKQDVRQIAQTHGLASAGAKDSQEICFVPNGDYAGFILAKNYKSKPGNFIGPTGQNLGPHKGLIHYTVGQRRGLGISAKEPLFVKSLNNSGDIELDFAQNLFLGQIALCNMFSTSGTPLPPGDYSVKIRSMAKATACQLIYAEDGSAALIFNSPQRAPAKGQHAVLYLQELVVGGGVIGLCG